jgi:hypothetical protein
VAGLRSESSVTGQSLCCARPSSFVMKGRGSLVLCTQRPLAALAALAAPAHAYVLPKLTYFSSTDLRNSLLLSSAADEDPE